MINLQISKKVFNNIYLPYLDNEDKYLIFYGGGSSGKSYFIGQRYIYKNFKKKMNLLVVRQTGNTNRLSTFALLKQVINNWNLSKYFKINESDMRIKCLLNGNEIVFAGLDDPEKLKSITFENGELTDIWVEEATECDEKAINQLKVRLRGGKSKKQMVLSFNPININHWIKKHFIDSKLATVVHTTYKDNKFLTEEDKKTLEDFKDTDPYYYQVYCLGQWGVLGKTIFDSAKINERLSQIPKPIKTGYFIYDYDDTKLAKGQIDSFGCVSEGKIINIRWINDPNGTIQIYKVPNVPQITKYAIGGDTAGDGSDYFVGQVIDAKTGEQVATFRQQMDEDLYTKQMYCLGSYYGWAKIGIESNFSTYPNMELQRLGYPNLYIREKQDTYTGKLEKTFGFKTTSVTRPLLISNLVEIVRENTELLNDKITLEEMLTFVRNEKGKPEAQQGAHDDTIMALGIAYEVRNQTVFNEEIINVKPQYQFSFEENYEIQGHDLSYDIDYGEEIVII